MKKLILTLFVFLIFSCATDSATDSATNSATSSATDSATNSATSSATNSWKGNTDLFPNTEVPGKIKSIVNSSLAGWDYVLFDTFRTYIPAEKIFVMQALDKNTALAHIAHQKYRYADDYVDRYDNLALLAGNNDYFYDDQVINVGPSQEVKQIGVYTYQTRGGTYTIDGKTYTIEGRSKTVPIVVVVGE